MLTDVLPFLACPHCASELTLVGSSLRCATAHTFDIARQGYVNLLSGKSSGIPGDTAAMVPALLKDVFGVIATTKRHPDGVIRIAYASEPLA